MTDRNPEHASDNPQTTDSPQISATVYDHIAMMLDQMASVAWQKMGLQPEMMTGKIQADFTEAKVAVDVCDKLASILERELDDNDRRQLQNLVRDLKMNYVQRQSGGA